MKAKCFRNCQTNRYFMIKILLIMLLPLLLTSTTGAISTVNANSDNSVSCYERGVIDGEDHPFNQRTHGNCGDEYYQGFLYGCMSVEGNSKNICESATDA